MYAPQFAQRVFDKVDELLTIIEDGDLEKFKDTLDPDDLNRIYPRKLGKPIGSMLLRGAIQYEKPEIVHFLLESGVNSDIEKHPLVNSISKTLNVWS
jgi:hypothetical protein